MQEQGAATQEIVRNIQTTSIGVNDISKTLGQIGEMSQENTSNAAQVLGAADSLSKQARDLSSEIKTFIQSAKAI